MITGGDETGKIKFRKELSFEGKLLMKSDQEEATESEDVGDERV